MSLGGDLESAVSVEDGASIDEKLWLDGLELRGGVGWGKECTGVSECNNSILIREWCLLGRSDRIFRG